MKLRLSLELHVTRHKPNKPEPEADHKPEPGEDHQPEDENYAVTERAHPEPEGTLHQTRFSTNDD